MKAHIVVKYSHSLEEGIPSWQTFVKDKSRTFDYTHTQIDNIFKAHNIPIYITTEYQPGSQDWNNDELEAGLNRFYRIILRDRTSIPHGIIEQVRLLSDVEEVRPFQVSTTRFPSYDLSGAMSNRRSRYHLLNDVHRSNRGNENLIIAVLDTGVDVTHPELVHACLPGYDFVHILDGADSFVGDFLHADPDPDDEIGHGTHVAGIIAGKGNQMPTGLAPECKILPVRVLGSFVKEDGSIVGAGLLENIDAGIKYAVDQGAQIINMSLGVRHEGGGLPHEEVIEYARKKGVTIIAAAGNDGMEEKYYPGANPYVIAVGASDPAGEIAGFSTYGVHVSVVAPGTRVYSSYKNNGYAFSSGTSQAAPFVSGVTALLKSEALRQGKKLSNYQVKYLIKHTSDKIDRRIKHIKAGYGHINLTDAIKLMNYKLNT